jgi:hypothetical protein
MDYKNTVFTAFGIVQSDLRLECEGLTRRPHWKYRREENLSQNETEGPTDCRSDCSSGQLGVGVRWFGEGSDGRCMRVRECSSRN